MTSGNFRPLRPVRALSHPTNTPQMPSMSGRAHLGWIRNLVFQGIVRCTLPTKVPLMVNPYYKPYTMVFVGYIPWVYTVRGYTQKCPLSFLGIQRSPGVHPRMIPIRYTGRCLFFANQKAIQRNRGFFVPIQCVKRNPL